MKLCELKGVKKFYKMDSYEFHNELKKQGIACIAGGKYGQVYTSPDWDYVVKVFEDDPYYMSFVNYVLKNPSNHFPKIKKKPLRMHAFIRRKKSEANHFYTIKIEKLYEIKDKDLLRWIVQNLEYYGETAWRLEHGHQKVDDRYFVERDPQFPRHWPDGSVRKSTSMKDVFDEYPWVRTLGLDYIEMIASGELEGSPDIHDKNLMQRKDGTIVIIDPVWEGSNPYKEYDAWYRTETDYGGGGEDIEREPDVEGPDYLHKKDIAPEVKVAMSNFDDDIPF